MPLVYAGPGRPPTRCQVRVELKQRSSHTVGPAEAVLERILPAAPGEVVLDVVFLDQLSRMGEYPLDGDEPAASYLMSERRLIVTTESDDRDPLQRRPAIGRVPLLTRVDVGRDDPALREQPYLRDRANGVRLTDVGDTGEERIERRRAELSGAPLEPPVIIHEVACLGVPQIAVDRPPAAAGAPGEILRARGVATLRAATGDRPLQSEEEAVEVDRHDLGRTDRCEMPAVRKPA